MSGLKITKFGFIHKDKKKDAIIFSDFELEGDYKGGVQLAIIDAVIEEFKQAREEIIKENTND